MARALNDDDYLDLYKYFEDRADNVKEAMFNSVTWVLGFAAAVFAFIVTRLVSSHSSDSQLVSSHSSDSQLVSPTASAPPIASEWVLSAAILGFVFCAYAVILVIESKKHIQRNWARARACMRQIDGLDSPIAGLASLISTPMTPEAARPFLQRIWNQILLIVILFASGFSGVLVWAFL